MVGTNKFCCTGRNLFVTVIMIGELSCFCTLFVKDYTGLFITRSITGVSIGGANPLIMSMIGDSR
jgi:MFS family permease